MDTAYILCTCHEITEQSHLNARYIQNPISIVRIWVRDNFVLRRYGGSDRENWRVPVTYYS